MFHCETKTELGDQNNPTETNETEIKNDAPQTEPAEGHLPRKVGLFVLTGSGWEIQEILSSKVVQGFKIFVVRLAPKNKENVKTGTGTGDDVQNVSVWEAYNLFPSLVKRFHAAQRVKDEVSLFSFQESILNEEN